MDRDLAGLRIGLLTASASRLGGGVFEAVVAQVAMVRARGGEAPVFALRDAHSDDDAARFAGAPLRHLGVVGPAMVGLAPRLGKALLDAQLDCLHLHGIWMYPSRAASVWAARTGRPYLVSPHGMLDPWITGRGRAKKALARLCYERASWRAARAFHALTAREARDIARETGRDDTFVIPNAGPPARRGSDDARAPRFVYIGRIHPKKNLGVLIAAWRSLAAPVAAARATLTIAGWGEPAHVADLRASLARTAHAAFVGECYGEAKAKLLREARFVVLPSLSEGLPMAMLEAWAAGTPTIMSAACNLPEGFAAGAAIECGTDAASIAGALTRALAIGDAEWRAMADAAHTLANGRFAATTVAGEWARRYRALIAPARVTARA